MIDLLMLIQSALSGGTYLAAKRALAELSPFEVALARFSLAALVYAGMLAWRTVRVPRRDLARLAALGFVAIPVNQGSFLAGLSLTTPGHAALMYALTPVFVFLIGVARREERASAGKVAGIAIAFAGAAVVLFSRGLLSGGEGLRGLAGDLLVLVAVVAWAVYVVESKPLVERYGAVTTTSVSVIAGTLLYLPVGLWFARGESFVRLSAAGWWSVAYLVVLTSVVSYLIFLWALSREDASRVAIWSNTQPVFTALLAWAIRGEPLSLAFVAGGALVIAGVVVTERG